MAAPTSTQPVDFDVIVVGAGIAGCVTAHQLARAGHDVLVVERGPQPGAKNVSGGVLYCRVLEEIWPDFVDRAPVERVITRYRLAFLNPGSQLSIDYQDDRLASPTNAVSVLRARLDPWLADRCEDAGATVMSGMRVDQVVVEAGRVVGIRVGDDVLRSHVVVAADGVSSFLCRDAGLRDREPTRHLALGVKSVVALPRNTIEERFTLTGREGVAVAAVGDCTGGLGGGGFLYTNLESVSVGVVVRLDELTRSGASSSELHDRFLTHPAISPYLRDGEIVEYGAHLIAEGGRAMVHDLTRPGLVVVGDAAGLTLNTGFTVRGMDLAAGSGIAAARTIHEALAAGDPSLADTSDYPAELDRSFVGRDLATYARAPRFFENPRLYQAYGQLLADGFRGVYDLDTSPRRHLLPTFREAFRRSPVTKRQLARDGLSMTRAL